MDYVYEFAITIPQERTTPFHNTQSAFLHEIATNALHIVYNIRDNAEGYIGESAATEIAYVLILGKPIIRIRDNVVFGDRVADELQQVVTKNLPRIPVLQLDKMSSDDLVDSLSVKYPIFSPHSL